jgi:hypothetical protein
MFRKPPIIITNQTLIDLDGPVRGKKSPTKIETVKREQKTVAKVVIPKKKSEPKIPLVAVSEVKHVEEKTSEILWIGDYA